MAKNFLSLSKKNAIKFFNLAQLTWKMSQIEANTYGYEFRLISDANN